VGRRIDRLRRRRAQSRTPPGRLGFETTDGERIDVELAPVAPSIMFDMAHTCQVPEQWSYWRTLVEARVAGWDGPCRGWFEASRYGAA
jgi:hypothetical protein